MKQKKELFSIYFPFVVIFLIAVSIVVYSFSIKNFFKNQASYSAENNVEIISKEIDFMFLVGQNRINLISNLTSDMMNSRELVNDKVFSNTFTNESFFSSIEYIRWDGQKRIPDTDLYYDVSSLEYFKDGMKGNSGIWVDFNPETSKTALINFYSPIYYSNQVAGILTGCYEAETKIKPLLNVNFYGYKTINMLVDEKFRIIAATEDDIPSGLDLKELTDDDFAINLILNAKKNNNKSYKLYSDVAKGFCCVKKLTDSSCYVVHLIPLTSINGAIKDLNLKTYTLIGAIILFIIIYIILSTRQAYSKQKRAEISYLNVIEALSHDYQDVYVINAKTSEIQIYNVAHDFGKKLSAMVSEVSYEQAIKLYYSKDVEASDRKLFEPVNTVEKVSKVLSKEKEYSFIYRVSRNGRILFFQAYLSKPKEGNNFVIAFKNIDNIIASENRALLQNQIISSISKVYLTLHLVDLVNDTVKEFTTVSEVKAYVNAEVNASMQMTAVMTNVSVPEDLERLLEFTNLETIADRMKDKVYISMEFRSLFKGWIRANFIRVESDSFGRATKVIFTTQVIDDEKRKEQRLISIANTDELTHLLNRHAYEVQLKMLAEKGVKEDFAYISCDINGLKSINDNIGHDAGDELIRSAAGCATNAFGTLGKIYRTGGDEFQIILNGDADTIAEACQNFETMQKEWKGKLIDKLSISYGLVRYAENLNYTLKEIIQLADKRMYKAKSAYYIENKLDRRK